jgi:hypothetical protein
MGVRRRQLQGILSAPEYDSMILAEDRDFPFTKGMAGNLKEEIGSLVS